MRKCLVPHCNGQLDWVLSHEWTIQSCFNLDLESLGTLLPWQCMSFLLVGYVHHLSLGERGHLCIEERGVFLILSCLGDSVRGSWVFLLQFQCIEVEFLLIFKCHSDVIPIVEFIANVIDCVLTYCDAVMSIFIAAQIENIITQHLSWFWCVLVGIWGWSFWLWAFVSLVESSLSHVGSKLSSNFNAVFNRTLWIECCSVTASAEPSDDGNCTNLSPQL